jgi:hypothetical protein
MKLEHIIQKLGEVSHNLTMIKICEIDGSMTKEMADLIEDQNCEIRRLIGELEKLDLSAVSNNEERVAVCHHEYINAGMLQFKAMKQCLKCGDYRQTEC